ncbi:MAG: PAS domain S-box protein, partial [Acidobacteriota bacterium]|nr:PAS domain S-box protein [Acidobacteriota bacterium]
VETEDGDSGGQFNNRVLSALKVVSKVASLVIILIGCGVLVGWALDIPTLKSISTGLVTMKANTAAAFVLAGLSLWLLRTGQVSVATRRVAQACALAVASVGLLTLSEYLFGWNLGIDQLLFHELQRAGAAYAPGRMAPVVALNFLLLGTALLLLAARRGWPAQLLTLTAALLSLLVFSGYVYSVESLYRIGPFSATALHTTVTFILLCGGILFARADRGPVAIVVSDTAGGLLARRLLPAAVVIPLALGWVRLKGQEAGLYDTHFGVSLLALSNLIIFSLLIWGSAVLLSRTDERRRRAQDSLRESGEQLRLAVEATKLGTWDLNPRTGERRWSERCRAMFGLPAGTVVGSEKVLERIHPADRGRVNDAVQRALQPEGDGELHIEYRTSGSGDGVERWVESHGRAFFEGGRAARLIGTVLDITERKRAESALRNAATVSERDRAQLEAVIQAVADGIMVSDMAGNFILANEAEARILGYPSPAEMKRNISYFAEVFELYNPDGQPVPFGDWPLAKVLRGESFTDWELRGRRKDTGQEWFFSFSGEPVRDECGEQVLAVIVTRDVTGRKQLEEQFRQAQKMEAVGQLAGGVAHDFNNLLTAIMGYGDLSLRRLKEGDPLYRNVEEIRKAAERACALTRQLLAFSRKQVLQPKVLNLNSVVSDTEKMLRRLIREDVELITILRPTAGRISVDPGQLEQVVMNLVVNARDAMPEGGKLTVETAGVELDKGYAKTHFGVSPGRYAVLTVSDTGVGMDRETQKHIFEPFFTTKEVGKGTGLGLSTVYGIIKQSGGNISVYSEPGVGTTFRIYLPEVEGRAEAEEKGERVESPRGSETILLVEDEELVRSLTRDILQLSGYQVLEAASGDEALAVCEQFEGAIHLLLTDVIMPGMSGRAVAERLQAIRPALRVLYMSGYTDDALSQHGMLEPSVSLLEKPFSPDSLIYRVRAALDEKSP